MLLKSLSFLGLIAATASQATTPANIDLRIDSVETRCLNCPSESIPMAKEFVLQPNFAMLSAPIAPASPLDSADLVKVGQELWKLVQANKPVVQIATNQVSVLPLRTLNWSQLTNWNPPVSRIYQVLFKNHVGQTLIDFNYQVIFTAGGRYQGKGDYLSQVTVIPSHVSVAWGANLEAEASVPNIVNLGTLENPVAGAEVHVKWRIKNVFQDIQETKVYFVNGLGAFKALN